jgi:hypothetical protein
MFTISGFIILVTNLCFITSGKFIFFTKSVSIIALNSKKGNIMRTSSISERLPEHGKDWKYGNKKITFAENFYFSIT